MQDKPKLSDMVPLKKLHEALPASFFSEQAVYWQFRRHRPEYIAAGAVVEVCGRLMAHPPTFERVALEIGSRTLAERHGVGKPADRQT